MKGWEFMVADFAPGLLPTKLRAIAKVLRYRNTCFYKSGGRNLVKSAWARSRNIARVYRELFPTPFLRTILPFHARSKRSAFSIVYRNAIDQTFNVYQYTEKYHSTAKESDCSVYFSFLFQIIVIFNEEYFALIIVLK